MRSEPDNTSSPRPDDGSDREQRRRSHLAQAARMPARSIHKFNGEPHSYELLLDETRQRHIVVDIQDSDCRDPFMKFTRSRDLYDIEEEPERRMR